MEELGGEFVDWGGGRIVMRPFGRELVVGYSSIIVRRSP